MVFIIYFMIDNIPGVNKISTKAVLTIYGITNDK